MSFSKSSLFLLLCLLCRDSLAANPEIAGGRVFHDSNGNGIWEAEESGIAGTCVSNGTEVVVTDSEGKWSLAVRAGDTIFAIQPSGWQAPVDEYQRPRFYYHHKPEGSPPLAVPGVAPTGPLPANIDFGFTPSTVGEDYSALVFGDPQARGLREVNFVAHDVIEECLGTEASIGMTLGDIVADDPALFGPLSEAFGQIGIPLFQIFGNHDHNRDASQDEYTDETFERFFGPSTYAFEVGQVCFIGYKNKVYYKPDGGYDGKFTDRQIAFTRNYLKNVPEERLIVLLMHVPIISCDGKEDILALLSDRPHTLSISAHFHQMFHLFLNERWGWTAEEPHHHFIAPTVSGSWWCGLDDELGIPHATMNDGAPNGYSILTFEGNKYSIEFKAARRPADYQMNIYLAEDVSSATSEEERILVNVFNGSERSVVEMRIDAEGEWWPLSQTNVPDPQCLRMHQLSPILDLEFEGRKVDELLGWKMDDPRPSRHIWAAQLPPGLPPGTHTVTVRTTDMFGQTYRDGRIFRVN